MTREELITLAHKANINVHTGKSFAENVYVATLERFAAVVAQHEREACAKLCESYDSQHPHIGQGAHIAKAIRARGKA